MGSGPDKAHYLAKYRRVMYLHTLRAHLAPAQLAARRPLP
jgi:hypothetical protein